MHAGNAVYGSVDCRGHVNCRISKTTHRGEAIVGGNYNARQTACRHEAIDYIPMFDGLTAEQVNARLKPMLCGGSKRRRRRGTPEARVSDMEALGQEAIGALAVFLNGGSWSRYAPPSKKSASGKILAVIWYPWSKRLLHWTMKQESSSWRCPGERTAHRNGFVVQWPPDAVAHTIGKPRTTDVDLTKDD